MEHIRQFPHCDQKVLHAPSDGCVYCNAHPEWQELRQAWGIAFTGHSNDTVKAYDRKGQEYDKPLIPCPSEWDRPLTVIHAWGGNRPRKAGEGEEEIKLK